MNYEVKTYKFICDICKQIEFVRDVPGFIKPIGWSLEQDSASYGYKYNDICAACLEKKQIKEVFK